MLMITILDDALKFPHSSILFHVNKEFDIDPG